MVRTLRMLYMLLSDRERRRALQVFALMLLMAFVETLGVVSIVPFVAVLATPEILERNAVFQEIFQLFGFSDPQSFLILLGSTTLIIFLLALALKAATTYAMVRFAAMRAHSLSYRLLSVYLGRPYSFFLGRNSADLVKSVLSETSGVATGVLLPSLRLLAGSVVAIALLGLLLAVEPLLSLFAAAILGGSFGAVYIFTRRLLKRIGGERLIANQQRFVLANEALNGIKELQLLGHVDSYLQRFWKPSARFATYQATGALIRDLPQFGIQGIAFGGALGTLLYLTSQKGSFEEAVPLVTLYAFAGYRLMPAFQLIFSNLAKIRFAVPALEAIYEDLVFQESRVDDKRRAAEMEGNRPRGTIRLENVSFSYPNVEKTAVNDLSLSIPQGSSAAFVGSTGAGKSTVVDLILGLLHADSGSISVGGKPLSASNLKGWQKTIGYVPQSTYLADDTIAANIAFGVPGKEIDLAAVRKAAKAAQIDEFVTQDLPQGYQTVVGERGIRLSGGQRQRIAIARALYHDPEVVVFDEATSALDNVTEAVVMKAIEALRGTKTVIIIAHRISTVEHCDCIFVMREGRLCESGRYLDLLASSAVFKKLARAKDN